MNKIAIIALIGAASTSQVNYDKDAFYGNGNAGRNPHETLDAYWHAAHDSKTTEEFHKKSALQGAFVPASHQEDGAPTYHNNGGFVQQNGPQRLV